MATFKANSFQAYGNTQPDQYKVESQKAGDLCKEDDFENYNNFCSQQLLKKPMTVTRTFIAWEEGWEKFNSIVQVMRSLLQGFLLSMKILMWYDPDSRTQMHSAWRAVQH